MQMPHLIELVVNPDGAGQALLIDGTEFPWYIAPNITIDINDGEMQTVTVTLMTDKVTVHEK